MNTPPGLYDEALASTRIEFGIARAEVALMSATRAQAEQWAAVVDVLSEARQSPEVFVGELLAGAPDGVEFAIRAAVADLAVRLGVAESTVRTQAHHAEQLIARAPQVWAWFREGEFAAPNARLVAELVSDLPRQVWAEFDAAMVELRELAPARFRAKARSLASRLNPAEMGERHRVAATERRVWIENDRDGMAWLGAYLPAEDAHRAFAHIDQAARSLAAAPDETRTVAQLRADTLTDLLAGVLGAPGSVGVTVAVTVPVLALLGGDQPATLDGYGPIDAATARQLAAHAPSFTRILTHPISGSILDIDRVSYRPPADLARWVRITRPTCDFPGCGRASIRCDLDHTVPWPAGPTAACNLAPLCRHHHRLKHHTAWTVINAGTCHGLIWTSPTGHVRGSDPPPF